MVDDGTTNIRMTIPKNREISGIDSIRPVAFSLAG